MRFATKSNPQNVAAENVRGSHYCSYFVVKQLAQTFPHHLNQYRVSSYGVACLGSTLNRLVTITSYATRKPSDHAVGLRIRGLKHNAIQQSRPSERPPNGSHGRRRNGGWGYYAQLVCERWQSGPVVSSHRESFNDVSRAGGISNLYGNRHQRKGFLGNCILVLVLHGFTTSRVVEPRER